MSAGIVSGLKAAMELISGLPRLGLLRRLKAQCGASVELRLEGNAIVVGHVQSVTYSTGLVRISSIDTRSAAVEDIPTKRIVSARFLADDVAPDLAARYTVLRVLQRLVISEHGALTLHKSEELEPRSPGVQRFFDTVTASGDWDPTSFKSKLHPLDTPCGELPSTMLMSPSPAGKASAVDFEHRFASPLLRGEIYLRETVGEFPPCTYLCDSEDTFSHVVRQPEREFRIELEFPRSKAPQNVKVVKKTATTPAELLETLAVDDTGHHVAFERKGPAIGETYTLQWLNSKATREATKRAARGPDTENPGG